MNNTIDKAAVLSFFSGKARETAAAALDLINECLVAGEWAPGVSRKVTASLNKPNEAIKVVRKAEKDVEIHSFDSVDRSKEAQRDANALWYAAHSLRFGHFQAAVANAVAKHKPVAKHPDHQPIVPLFERYVAAFRPVVEAMAFLDRQRPKPVITAMNLSPLQTSTIEAMGCTAVAPCPIEWIRIERKDGVYVIGRLKWPEGTRHNTSPKDRADHCQACGHSIKNIYNWVPLVLTTPQGPASLWVGRDCAHSLFGIKVKGDLEIEGGKT